MGRINELFCDYLERTEIFAQAMEAIMLPALCLLDKRKTAKKRHITAQNVMNKSWLFSVIKL